MAGGSPRRGGGRVESATMTAVPTTRAPEAQPGGPGDLPPDEAPRRKKRRLRRIVVGLLVVVLLAVAGATAFVLGLQARLEGQIERIPSVFSGLENRPEKATSGPAASALNILLMGTDRRAELSGTGSEGTGREWVPGAQRTDTIMILHIDGDRDGASLISIPRDSWVDVDSRAIWILAASARVFARSSSMSVVGRSGGMPPSRRRWSVT
jgi:anionic cell wall polymer biosynthesis LytR-Cps2A-Psr (LCP) family protein